MIALGLRLRWLPSDRLSWRDLLIIVKQAPRDSATRHAVDPTYLHTFELELLRSTELSARTLLWAKTRDGEHGRNVPQPARFPWEPKPVGVFPADVLPLDEMKKRLGW